MVPLIGSFAILVALVSSGCACGRLGTLAQRRTLTGDAEVIDVYGLGALLRPWVMDGGFTFGWHHATYIYPRLRRGGDENGVRWNFCWLPTHRSDPFFLSATSVGAGITKYPGVIQTHIGFRMDVFTFAASAGESRVVRFHYRPGAPGKTTLSMKPLPQSTLP